MNIDNKIKAPEGLNLPQLGGWYGYVNGKTNPYDKDRLPVWFAEWNKGFEKARLKLAPGLFDGIV